MHISNFPLEVLLEIYQHAPTFEQIYIFPHVCKQWHTASTANKPEQKVKQFAQIILSKKYPQEEISDIVNLAKVNRLFTQVLKYFRECGRSGLINFIGGSGGVGPEKLYFSRRTITVCHQSYYPHTNGFNICWVGSQFPASASSVHIGRKKGRKERSIQVTLCFVGESLHRYEDKIKLFFKYQFHHASASKCIKGRKKSTCFLGKESEKHFRLIEGALELSFLINIEIAAYRNIATLLNVKKIKNRLKKGISCRVGPLGKITKVELSKKKKSDIKFKILELKKNCNILRWHASSDFDVGSIRSLDDTIRYCVLSKTLSKLAQHLKIDSSPHFAQIRD